MKKILLCLFFGFVVTDTDAQSKIFKITKEKLHDKIKGGWAGQTIGEHLADPMNLYLTELSLATINRLNGTKVLLNRI